MSDSKAATRAQLGELWRLLLDALIAELSKPREAISTDMLNVVRQVLRDAGITAEAGAIRDAKQTLQEMRDLTLPFPIGSNEEPHE